MPVSFLVKSIAVLFSVWLVLIWTDNLTHPSWLKEDVESLLSIPATIFLLFAFWDEIGTHFQKKYQSSDSTPVKVNIQNIFPTLQPELHIESSSPVVFPRYDTGNRQIIGPDDPILDPLLGKPLHGRISEIKQLSDFLNNEHSDILVTHTLVLAEGGVGKTEVCKAALRQFMRTNPYKKVWFITLEKVTDAAGLWQRLADAIETTVYSKNELLAALPAGIYYLDNLESLIGISNLAEHLRHVSQKPGVVLFASSRVAIPGWGKVFDLNVLPIASATALFREIWSETNAETIPSSSACK